MRPEFTEKPEFMRLAAAQKRNDLPMLLEVLAFILVFTCGTLAGGIISSIPATVWMLGGERGAALLAAALQGGDVMTPLSELFAQLPTWLLCVMIAADLLVGFAAVIYCKRFEHRSLVTMGLTKRHAVRHSLIGALLGALAFSAVVGLAGAFGGVRMGSFQATAALLPTLLILLLAFLLQSLGEELLLRGYLMTSLSKHYRLPICIVVSAAIFGVMNVNSISLQPVVFLNVVLAGIILALLVLKSGDLWCACGFHALWNFFQNGVFGLSYDGVENAESLFSLTVTGHSDVLTGGAYGLEGSLCATFVQLAIIGVLIWLLRRNAPEASETEEDPDLEG